MSCSILFYGWDIDSEYITSQLIGKDLLNNLRDTEYMSEWNLNIHDILIMINKNLKEKGLDLTLDIFPNKYFYLHFGKIWSGKLNFNQEFETFTNNELKTFMNKLEEFKKKYPTICEPKLIHIIMLKKKKTNKNKNKNTNTKS